MRNEFFKTCGGLGALYVLIILSSSVAYNFILQDRNKETIEHVRKVCPESVKELLSA